MSRTKSMLRVSIEFSAFSGAENALAARDKQAATAMHGPKRVPSQFIEAVRSSLQRPPRINSEAHFQFHIAQAWMTSFDLNAANRGAIVLTWRRIIRNVDRQVINSPLARLGLDCGNQEFG